MKVDSSHVISSSHEISGRLSMAPFSRRDRDVDNTSDQREGLSVRSNENVSSYSRYKAKYKLNRFGCE